MKHFILLFTFSTMGLSAFGQLSEGQGQLKAIPSSPWKMYVPKHFRIQEDPPGVVHLASGTMVVVLEIPEDKKVGPGRSMPESFMVDSRMEKVKRWEDNFTMRGSAVSQKGRLQCMSYTIDNYEMERLSLLMERKGKQYLVMGNYFVTYKSQVLKEVKKIMSEISTQ